MLFCFNNPALDSHTHQIHHQQQTNTTHNWPDDLIEIVAEPMSQTLDRMRRFSNSLSNVDRGRSHILFI